MLMGLLSKARVGVVRHRGWLGSALYFRGFATGVRATLNRRS